MINPITSAVPPQAAAQTTGARTPSPKAEKASAPSAAAVPTDTVKISSAAAALAELTETAAQTAKEAGAGDPQAQRLLAKEEAERQ